MRAAILAKCCAFNQWIGIYLEEPLVTQVSRFDPWKDSLGIIAAFQLAKRFASGLQLALVGSMALDDPEGWQRQRARLQTGSSAWSQSTNISNSHPALPTS